MKKTIICILMATLFLSGCAHTTAYSPYSSGSYNSGSSTFENIIGFGILAAATTGLVLAAVSCDGEDYAHHNKASFPDNKHKGKHEKKPINNKRFS